MLKIPINRKETLNMTAEGLREVFEGDGIIFGKLIHF